MGELGHILAGTAYITTAVWLLMVGVFAPGGVNRSRFLNFTLLWGAGITVSGAITLLYLSLQYNQSFAGECVAYFTVYCVLGLELFGSMIASCFAPGMKQVEQVRGRVGYKPLRKDGGALSYSYVWAEDLYRPLLMAGAVGSGIIHRGMSTFDTIPLVDFYNHTEYALSPYQIEAIPITHSVLVGVDFAIVICIFSSMAMKFAYSMSALHLAAVGFFGVHGVWRIFMAVWILSPYGETVNANMVITYALLTVVGSMLTVGVFVAAVTRMKGTDIRSFMPYSDISELKVSSNDDVDDAASVGTVGTVVTDGTMAMA